MSTPWLTTAEAEDEMTQKIKLARRYPVIYYLCFVHSHDRNLCKTDRNSGI